MSCAFLLICTEDTKSIIDRSNGLKYSTIAFTTNEYSKNSLNRSKIIIFDNSTLSGINNINDLIHHPLVSSVSVHELKLSGNQLSTYMSIILKEQLAKSKFLSVDSSGHTDPKGPIGPLGPKGNSLDIMASIVKALSYTPAIFDSNGLINDKLFTEIKMPDKLLSSMLEYRKIEDKKSFGIANIINEDLIIKMLACESHLYNLTLSNIKSDDKPKLARLVLIMNQYRKFMDVPLLNQFNSPILNNLDYQTLNNSEIKELLHYLNSLNDSRFHEIQNSLMDQLVEK